MHTNFQLWKLGLLGLQLHISLALVSELEIKNDRRSAFHISSFGYERDGHFFMMVKDFLLMVPHDYNKPDEGQYDIAFVLQRSSNDGGFRLEENADDICYHKTMLNANDIVINFNDRVEWPEKKFMTVINNPGWYHLYFSNCEKSTHTTFTLALEEYNVEVGTNTKIFLSAGENSMPTCLSIICVLFLGGMITWGYVMFSRKKDVGKIHGVMTVVILFKILSLLFESIQLHALKYTGKPDVWRIIYYIVSSMKSLLFFSSIVLIGTGYGYLRWFLTDRDRQIMVAVLAVQVMVNIAIVVLDETSEGTAGWLTWRDLLHVLDILCCCVILLPIVSSIRHLKDASSTDGKVARNMERLKNFRKFYLLVVCYVYFTRIVVFLLSSTLPYNLSWLSRVFDEAATLIFYSTTGWLFRPQSRNPYLALENQENNDTSTPAPSAIEMTVK